MRRLYVALVLALGLLQATSVYGQSSDDEVLTNESIVKLVQSGIGANLIVKMIEEQPSNFRLGSAGVIQLKQKGVPQSVISAMISKKSGGATPGAGAAAAPASAAPGPRQPGKPVTPNYAWTEVNKTDPITNKQTFAVMLDTPALSEDGGARQGTFEVTATCNTADTTLQVVFLSDATPGVGFKQNTETYYVSGGLAGALTVASHHQKPWTVTRIRVGENEGKQVTSEDDYKNAVDVYFTAPQPTAAAASQDEAGMRALLQFASFIGPNKPAGETGDLFRAKNILMEMELENGVKTLLTLRPQDPVFQNFRARCDKLVPERVSSPYAGNEIRPPDRSAPAGTTSTARSVPASPPPPPPQRFVVPVGTQLSMRVQEAMDLNGVHQYQMVHAQLTAPVHAATGAAGSAAATPLALEAGTDIFLRCTAAAAGNQLNVRLELDHALVHGVSIPLHSEVQTRQTSRGITMPSTPIRIGGIGAVRLPQSHTPPDPVLVPAKEQLTFNTSQITYAPPGFKP